MDHMDSSMPVRVADGCTLDVHVVNPVAPILTKRELFALDLIKSLISKGWGSEAAIIGGVELADKLIKKLEETDVTIGQPELVPFDVYNQNILK